MLLDRPFAGRLRTIDVHAINGVGLAALALGGLALSRGIATAPALAILVISGIVAIAAPEAIAAGIAAAIPLIFHPVPIHGQHFSLLELALLCGIGGLGLRTLWAMRKENLQPLLVLAHPWSISASAALLVLVSVFSLKTVADPSHLAESERSLRVVIVEPIFALLIFRDLARRGRVWFATAALIGMGCVVSVLALRDVVSGQSVVLADGVARAKGTYPHPNNLALYLDRVALFAIGLAVVDAKRRRWLVPASVALVVGMALTLSRGAALAGFVGVAVVIAMARPRHGWRWFAAGAIAAAATFAIFATTRFTATGGETESARVLIWRSSVHMVRDHPIYGVGLDQFLYQYGRRYVSPDGWAERYTSHPHDVVLDVWLSLGMAGLVVFAGLIVAVVKRAWKAMRDARFDSAFVVAAAAALTGGLAHGFVDNSFFLPDLATLTWIMIALLEARAEA